MTEKTDKQKYNDTEKYKSRIEELIKNAMKNLEEKIFYNNLKRGNTITGDISDAIRYKQTQGNVRREINELMNDRNNKVIDKNHDENLLRRINYLSAMVIN